MLWLDFPKRLRSALKCLCCLTGFSGEMQSQEIAKKIGVSRAETAKVLQLLVWGGFVTSRRGSKGGFQLAARPDQTTAGEVVNFFLAKHPAEPDVSCPVMRALRETVSPCQEAFARLTLADIAAWRTKTSHSRAAGKAGGR
jgi:Rrf2 family protein